MTWKSATKQFVSFRRSRGNPAPDEINCRCLSNDNHGVRRRGGGDGEIMAGHLAFLQAFPNLACFAPSFSKQSFGGFVGFQGVASLQNPKCSLPNFLPLPPSFNRIPDATPPHSVGSRRRGSSADGIGGSDVFIAGLIRAGANSQPSMNSTYWKEMSTFGSGPV
jgi:hypothetical protein